MPKYEIEFGADRCAYGTIEIEAENDEQAVVYAKEHWADLIGETEMTEHWENGFDRERIVCIHSLNKESKHVDLIDADIRLNSHPVEDHCYQMRSILQDILSECNDTFYDPECMSPEWKTLYGRITEVLKATENLTNPTTLDSLPAPLQICQSEYLNAILFFPSAPLEK